MCLLRAGRHYGSSTARLASLFAEEEAWAERHLDRWLEIRREYLSADRLRRYAYLTILSLAIPGLSDIVKVAYVRIDHFYKESWLSQGKPTRTREQLWLALDAAERSGIKIRAGLVLGRYETPESLEALLVGAAELCARYGGTSESSVLLLTLGVFPVEIIPGSNDFRWFRENASIEKAQEIFSRYERYGWISREDQRKLTRHFIEQTSRVSFDEVVAVQSAIVAICRQHGIIANDVDSGQLL